MSSTKPDIDYATFKKLRAVLDAEYNVASEAIRTFPRLANGLTPDSVRATTEYKSVKSQLDCAFSKVRAFNGKYVKHFSKEIKADIEAKRKAANTVKPSGGMQPF